MLRATVNVSPNWNKIKQLFSLANCSGINWATFGSKVVLSTIVNGIFNCGTGVANTFVDVANEIIKNLKKGRIKYINFPEHLKNAYQAYTCADISDLREKGFNHEFTSLKDAIREIYSICDKHFYFK